MTDKKLSSGDATPAAPKLETGRPVKAEGKSCPIRAADLSRAEKTFYATAPVARTAKATAQVTFRAQGYGLRPLSALELRSIYALFAWVANEQHAADETVRGMTAARFGVADITKLRQRDYDEVIKFLVDLRLDELKN